jgi:hypothetical protein
LPPLRLLVSICISSLVVSPAYAFSNFKFYEATMRQYGDEGSYGSMRHYGDEGSYRSMRQYGDEGSYGSMRQYGEEGSYGSMRQ